MVEFRASSAFRGWVWPDVAAAGWQPLRHMLRGSGPEIVWPGGYVVKVLGYHGFLVRPRARK